MPGDPKAHARAQFGAAASKYATSELHARGDSLSALVEMAGSLPGWTALDVATGAGHTAFALSPCVAQVLAVDLTEAMVAETVGSASAQRLNDIHAAVADAECLPCRLGT